MKVKNLKGTKDNTCHCPSWLKHWLEYSDADELPAYCVEKSCLEKPTVGAHVKKVGSTDNKWYIVPFCQSHNKQEDEVFTLLTGTSLAPAAVAETCGK